MSKLDKPIFIIEGMRKTPNDDEWQTIAYCNHPSVALGIHEAADNFLHFDIIEISQRQENGSYETISYRKLQEL